MPKRKAHDRSTWNPTGEERRPVRMVPNGLHDNDLPYTIGRAEDFDAALVRTTLRENEKLKKALLHLYSQTRILKRVLSDAMGADVGDMTAEDIRTLRRRMAGNRTDLRSGFSED